MQLLPSHTSFLLNPTNPQRITSVSKFPEQQRQVAIQICVYRSSFPFSRVHVWLVLLHMQLVSQAALLLSWPATQLLASHGEQHLGLPLQHRLLPAIEHLVHAMLVVLLSSQCQFLEIRELGDERPIR